MCTFSHTNTSDFLLFLLNIIVIISKDKKKPSICGNQFYKSGKKNSAKERDGFSKHSDVLPL